MANVRLQVRTIVNLGLWDKVCDYKGWNPWIRNEGRIDDDEWVDFDDTFNKQPEKIRYTAYSPAREFFFTSDTVLQNGDVIELNDKTYYITDTDDDNEIHVVGVGKTVRVYE